MTVLAVEITVRLVEIKNALRCHADPDVVDGLELELYREVLKGIALGEPHAVGHARLVFAVDRMKLAQQEADRKAAEEAAALAAAAEVAEVSLNSAVESDGRVQEKLSVYELRKRELAARLSGQLHRKTVE